MIWFGLGTGDWGSWSPTTAIFGSCQGYGSMATQASQESTSTPRNCCLQVGQRQKSVEKLGGRGPNASSSPLGERCPWIDDVGIAGGCK